MRQLFKLRRPLEPYQGLACGCAPGTHRALVAMIRRHVPPCTGVLDIGASSGALLLRLRNEGFADLIGTDLDTTRFALAGAGFRRLDLNRPFAADFDRKFHLITCSEVIEHLDSPREFMTQARLLLEEGGWLALSLPNVGYWEGRCKFMIRGELWGFGAHNYRVLRHISPITFEQMHMMMLEVGFELIESGTGGTFATPLRQAITLPIWAPIRLACGPSVLGESAIFLARKSEPVSELKEPVNFRDRWKGIARSSVSAST